MIPEFGHFSLILALCLAMTQVVLPLYGLYQKRAAYLQIARPLSLGVGLFICLSLAALLYALIHNDFSVAYIVQHSNSSLPTVYKISALWAGHEGSLLLWVLILSIWTGIVSISSRSLPLDFAARLLIILGFIAVGFLFFLLTTSNPFERLLPHYPLDGRDLNPLLQDPGLAIHPPLLYVGYVGFAIPFAFAITVLWLGQLQNAWVKWLRPFVLITWSFLTLGITLGSWWAYYELGWGGWWFWDPVENASFMPWLVGTALVHSVIISKKRQQFLGWTILLAILAFGLCLLGGFLVRSGVLTSVHAFANDPKRGLFILQLVALLLGSAFILYAVRAHTLANTQPMALYSRESLLMFSTMLLVVSALTILLGTVYPILYESITQRKISVGFPYFNMTFIPLMVPVLAAIPLGPFMKWGENYPFAVLNKLKWSLLLAVVLGSLLPWLIMKVTFASVIIGLSLAFWIILGTLQRVKEKGVLNVSLKGWGMVLGHLGMAIVVIGIVVVSNYQIESEVRVIFKQPIQIADYTVTLQEMKIIEGSNYIGHQGHFLVEKQGKWVSDLYPEKRLFVVPGISMTETAIAPGLFRDIYISLGEKLPDGGYSARIYYKPFVRWIWLGALMIAVGALMAAVDRKDRI